MNGSADTARHELRRQARNARRALNAEQRAEAELAVRDRLLASELYASAKRIGAYLAVASELSLAATIDAALEAGSGLYLPHVEHTTPEMRFAHWGGQQRRLLTNRFGIPEPIVEVSELVDPEQLDVILLPLLAFDRHGGRLGSGAGYYDRALAFRRGLTQPPWLIGIGFSCQEVTAIPMADWDVPLDVVVTERELIRIANIR